MTSTGWRAACLFVSTLAISATLAGEPVRSFTPQNGFGGESEGTGSISAFFGPARVFHVKSWGAGQVDGSFRLDQSVTFEGKPPQKRVWILTTTSPGRYSATLTDASGMATGMTSGARLSLRYRIRGPLIMHQELELHADGTTIDNVGVITLFGIPVGHLHETITRKLAGSAAGAGGT